ncbi:uncharacterized protein [Aristolochia californica]|uniref:uncharacterized protein n=1 Tax=Aristolochia californica TaxID=171875 RepID=UPI0035DE26F6
MALSSLSTDMAEIEVSALKEALLAQHQVIQKLHLELEEERESAATAASEALSMILRVQGAKAAEHMEASQYKRMTEEKLHHAEETLAVFEDLLCRKELEIVSLKFQVHAYRHKLQSIGFPDIDTTDKKFFECPSMYSNGAQLGDIGVQGIGRRASLPVMKFNSSRPEIASSQRKEASLSLGEMTTGKPEGDRDCANDIFCANGCRVSGEISAVPEESVFEYFHSCLEKMNDLDDKNCEEISKWVSATKEPCANIAAYSVSSNSECGCYCCFLQTEGGLSCSNSCAEDRSEFNKRCPQSPCVKDVYAVSLYQKQAAENLISKNGSKLREMESIPVDTTEDNGNNGKGQLSKQAACVQHELKMPTQSDVATNDFHCLVEDPKNGRPLLQSNNLEINDRVMKLENEIDTMKLEGRDKRTEELKLLRQINEQLESIKSQIRIPNAEKRSPPNKTMDSIIEAMLSFSI